MVGVLRWAAVAWVGLAAVAVAQERAFHLTVVDEATGEGMAGVKVEARAGEARERLKTGNGGELTIPLPESDLPYFRVEVEADGYVPMEATWRFHEGDTPLPDAFTLPLPRGTVIGGIIKDEAGDPIWRATVELLVPNDHMESRVKPSIWERRVRTKRDGTWSVDYMPEHLPDVWIRLSHPDYKNDNHFGDTPKPSIAELRAKTGVMVMKRGLTLSGRVTDTEGNHVAKADVKQGADRWGSEYPSVITRDDGTYAFNNTEEGEVVLTVQTEGYAPDVRRVNFTEATESVDFVLKPAKTVRGRVVDAEGSPLEGVRVVADTWRGFRAISWRGTTDAEGRWEWTNAPEDEVEFAIVTSGYMSARGEIISPEDGEYETVLYPPLEIAGRVVDAETNEPIPEFKIIRGIDWGREDISWSRRDVVLGANGNFEATFDYPYPGHALRVEAEGYLPADSRVFLPTEGAVSFKFEMTKGTSVAGRVIGPDGAVAADAEVGLAVGHTTVFVDRGQLRRDGALVAARTDDEGGFAFPPQADPYLLVALHDDGFAEVPREIFEATGEIRLEAWARVEGTVRIGGDPGAGETLSIYYSTPYRNDGPNVHFDFKATADDDGRFAFDRLIAGDLHVGRHFALSSRSWTTTHGVPVTLEPGATAEVTIGGKGRPIVGRFTLPERYPDEIDWSQGTRAIRSVIPDEAPGLKTILEDESVNTDIYYSYAFTIGPDGAFRAEDVPAGSYVLSLEVHEPPLGNQCGFGEALGSLDFQFEVPPMEGGRSDDPLDVGSHALTMRKALNVGELAPLFEVPTLNGGTVSLTDYRGKVLLLDFWATWCAPCVEETPNLKSVYEAFKDNPNFAMVALSVDQEIDAAKAFVEREGLAWAQGFLGNWGESSLPGEYGVYGIPATMIIGPDGRLLAKDLRGDATAEAVLEALEKVE